LAGKTPNFAELQPTCHQSEARNFETAQHINKQTRMWANAQPDGRPAEHGWRPQFNAAKFG